MTILVVLSVHEGLLDYFFWKRQMPPVTQTNQVSSCTFQAAVPKAIGVFQVMSDKGWSFSQKNSISWHIVLLMLYLYLAWWTSFAAHFIAKEMCFVSLVLAPRYVPVFREMTIFWNSLKDSRRSHLFLDRAYTMDTYRWERRWKIHVAPCARCPSFPVNFWALDTVNYLRP